METQREALIGQLEEERNIIRNSPLRIHNIMNDTSGSVIPDTPPPLRRTGRTGRRGAVWNIEPMNLFPNDLADDSDEEFRNSSSLSSAHYTNPPKKQLVDCVAKPCETTSCAICMDDLTQVDLMVTRCGHQFHSGCMITHLRNKDDCPLCRGILVA